VCDRGERKALPSGRQLSRDIMDKELKILRDANRDKAFLEVPRTLESDRDMLHRQA
jgi:hypothetical protein